MPDSTSPQPAVNLGSGGVMTNGAQLIRLKVNGREHDNLGNVVQRFGIALLHHALPLLLTSCMCPIPNPFRAASGQAQNP